MIFDKNSGMYLEDTRGYSNINVLKSKQLSLRARLGFERQFLSYSFHCPKPLKSF